jgi:hypothetical protein
MNYHTGYQHYWSAHEQDKVFGAIWDTYKNAWTGFSVANPEYEDDDMDKAVQWALWSARKTEVPTLTVMVLPAWTDASNTAYMRWLTEYPHNAKHLVQIPRKCFKFVKPTAWAEPEDKMAGHPKWDVNILLVGNKAGFDGGSGTH